MTSRAARLLTSLVPWMVLVAAQVRATQPSELPSPLEIGRRVELYKEIDGIKLHLYIFAPNVHRAGDRRPAVVFFFGGGWKNGSPTQFEPHCRYLASRGMVAATAEYRVESRHKTTPFECVKDGKSAVRWIRTHAVELGIDPDRIAAGGGSAGGHVAAATGVVPGLEEQDEDGGVSAKPNALVLFNPVYDNGPEGYGFDRVKERYREISPFHNIAKEAPPTIVFLGTKDALIPLSTAKAYAAKMEAVGSRCDTHFYEGQPHGFFNKGRSNGKYYAATVREMDRFLASLGWIDGKPTIQLVE